MVCFHYDVDRKIFYFLFHLGRSIGNQLNRPPAIINISSCRYLLVAQQQITRCMATETTKSTEMAAKPPSSTVLKLSDACIRKVDEICGKAKEPTWLRIIVDGGGCSGFQYKFELDTKLNDDDVTFGPSQRVVVDTISLDYCAGATLDYQVELIKSGFRMMDNPKAEQGCSCGASFALKL